MTPQAVTAHETGKLAENIAFDYLVQRGLSLLTRNYRCPFGEIDIIMEQGNIVTFIEVRYRKNNRYLAPIETINPQKCTRIINTGLHYLQGNRDALKKPCRFDVITVSGNLQSPDIMWIKNAFHA